MITPETILEAGEKIQKYIEAVKSLPEAAQQAAMNHTIEQFSYLEISTLSFAQIMWERIDEENIEDELLEKAQKLCVALNFLELAGVDVNLPAKKLKDVQAEIKAIEEAAKALREKTKELKSAEFNPEVAQSKSNPLKPSAQQIPDPWNTL